MMFKRRKRLNTAMPANIAIPENTAMPMYGNMAEIELFCVGVGTLLKRKYASILRVMS